MGKKRDKKFFTTGDVARYCEVDVNTVKRWIRNGNLKAFSTPSGHFRISRIHFISFINELGFTYDSHYFGETKNGTDILFVEYDSKQLGLFIDLLDHEYKNLKVETASNGFDGYLKVNLYRPRLIVLDLSVPKDVGLEFLRTIRAREDLKDLGVVVISNDIDSTMMRELQTLKVNCVMQKPVSKGMFKEKCESFLHVN